MNLMTLRKIINSDSGPYSSSKGDRAITIRREEREKKQKKKENLGSVCLQESCFLLENEFRG
jgi:hypothetical protein